MSLPNFTGQHVDLSKSRCRFRLSGEDRVRYLNGQVTNQVEKATSSKAIQACVCTHKGKLDGVIYVSADREGKALLIDGPIELRDHLFGRLAKYIIADDAELDDITDESTLIHVFSSSQDGAVANRFGLVGVDLWKAEAPSSSTTVSAEALEQFRIAHGVPTWGAELTHETLPAEAGLQKTAVDFHKGCYLGQEVVSRIQSVGRVNRELVILKIEDSDAEISIGASIVDPENLEGKPLGTITSIAPDGTLALGIVRHTHTSPETKLVSISQDVKVSIGLTVCAQP